MKVKIFLKRVKKRLLKPFLTFFAWISRKLVYCSHKLLMNNEWSIDNPEFFNHDCDLYYQFERYGRAYWVERGVFNILALQMFEKPILVELCCGEGFNTKFFYSYHAEEIYACDFCKEAIKAAKRKYSKSNITFDVADIRDHIPDHLNGGAPTNIIWDAAIEHFTPEEIDMIMKRIHEVLSANNGILSGYTIAKSSDDKMGIEQHEYEFIDMDDLKRFFVPYFKNVTVFETKYDDRTNFYFWASDGELPFGENWKHISKT